MRSLSSYITLVCLSGVCLSGFAMLGAEPKGLSRAQWTTIEAIRAENLRFETAEDGTKYIALRLGQQNANAVRVHVTGMRLGIGEKLFLADPSGTRVYGPFEGSGPLETGEFWSEPIPGSDVIVEFQAGPEPPADLPFAIESLAAGDDLSTEPVGVETGVDVAADGSVLFEGDILLNAVALAKTSGRSAVSITGAKYRWPAGTMPYVIASNIPSPARITEAIKHWNTTMAGYIRMVPRTTASNYVVFIYSSTASACSSYVGMLGYGAQPINVGNYCSAGNLIHEIGHAWGLWHEHTRGDRDRYVKINWANITNSQSYNFNQNDSAGDDLGAYDFNSVMHYGKASFSGNGLPTIETIPAGIPIGQRAGLSTGDIAAIRSLYPASVQPTPTVATTIVPNPVGATVVVDGVIYTAPVTLTWTAGSIHTVLAVSTVVDGVRRIFAGWSDKGAQAHLVTASPELTMLKADYSVSYSIKATATAGGGSVSISPTSASGFYTAGTNLTLTAQAAAGHCFAGWTGLIAGTPDRTTLSMVMPYSLQANFVPGSVTLSESALSVPAGGTSHTIGVTANSGCLWSASSTASWVSIAAPSSGSGSGTLMISVAPNTGAVIRSAQIVVGNQTFSVTQEPTK